MTKCVMDKSWDIWVYGSIKTIVGYHSTTKLANWAVTKGMVSFQFCWRRQFLGQKSSTRTTKSRPLHRWVLALCQEYGEGREWFCWHFTAQCTALGLENPRNNQVLSGRKWVILGYENAPFGIKEKLSNSLCVSGHLPNTISIYVSTSHKNRKRTKTRQQAIMWVVVCLSPCISMLAGGLMSNTA